MRLLVVEDDPELVAYVQKDLTRAGFAVDVADNGVDAEHLGDTEPYDAVVLDLGLPQKPGMDVLQAWRNRGNRVPVIVLTARDAWYERVDGFKAGADDYLGKPFHVEELIARIKALIYRRHGRSSNQIETRSLVLDEDVQKVQVLDGPMQELTGTEFRLLRYMMLNSGRILSKSHLSEHVYDQNSDRDSNLIEVYIRRLREKIGAQMILTKRGQGYIFNDPGKDESSV
ncbi:MAG: response regulator transcription factor [Granulosicoccus sp.]|nr:response regulator transcription factor [Granulosicoccus sp.]